MAKRLKTLNLCDASVERMKRYQGGQSAFARLAILDYDRNKRKLWDIQKELAQQTLFLEMNRENYGFLVTALLEAYGNGWTVEGMLIELLDKKKGEIDEIYNDGYLRTELRQAVSRRAMHGGDSPA